MRWRSCAAAAGLCALGLGVGILVAAFFPACFALFLTAFLLIACGVYCLLDGR